MDYETARANMIEQQIRPWNVLEIQTLNALGAIRREDFVPHDQRDLAFADVQIPLGGNEFMLEPKVSARMMEALHLSSTDHVLEIGTGTGYLTGLIAQVAGHVTSVEINPEFLTQAEQNLGAAGITNITLENGDGHAGWGDGTTFNAILISGSIAKIGAELTNSLADHGRLVGIEGYAPAMQAVVYRKQGVGVARQTLFETWAPRLINAEDKAEFVF